MIFRKFFVSYITPQIWKLSPNRKIQALQEFAATERDSGCQLLASIDAFKEPLERAHILRHALEEFRHGEIFSNLAKNYSDIPLETKFSSRKDLLSEDASESEFLSFIAYVYAGEEKINRQFSYYTTHSFDEEIRHKFATVAKDEEGHENSMLYFLKKYGAKRKYYIKLLILKSYINLLKAQIREYFISISGVFLATLIMFVYFFMGFFFYKAIKKRVMTITGNELVEVLIEEQKKIL